MPPAGRAAACIAIVPHGREIIPLMTVEENLKISFSALPRSKRLIPGEIYDLLPSLKDVLGWRGGMAITLVEKYFDFARELMNDYIVSNRGGVVIAGAASGMVEEDVRRRLTV